MSRLISHLSTSQVLSDHKTFPSFFRTVPSDAFQSLGLAKLVLHFGWTWIGLLAMDNDYGQQGIQSVRQKIIKGGACVAFSENIILNQPDRNAPHIVKVIRESTAKVVVVFSIDIHLIPILDEMLRQNVTKKIFVASEGWSMTQIYLMSQFGNIISGTIGLALYSEMIPGFSQFLNKVNPFMEIGVTWAKIFWQEAFNCVFSNYTNVTRISDTPLKECTGQEDLQSIHNSFTDVSNLRTTYNMYMAVHFVAKSLEDLSNCSVSDGPYPHCGDSHYFKPWQSHTRFLSRITPTLEGALQWATPLWERSDHVVQSAPLFLSTLKQVFLGPRVTHDMALQLLALTQGSSLVSHFAVHFRTLASELEWSDKALIPIFWRGLADHVKDALATREIPATLEELITLSTRIDLRFHERRLERAQCRQRFRLAPTFAKPLESPDQAPEPHEPVVESRAGSKSRTARVLQICHLCQQTGHLASRCLQRSRKRQRLVVVGGGA
ncbi:unnamed protein product [Ranitomeya imitator]|uniref:Receptor ligand binding region domain-containing protein n=1 Tax=Ranitomeya imitator TaxID=111125 RepID=A0ABN9M933_9NEOB|nr:unnamed protein product [Ranitomeya imitator]